MREHDKVVSVRGEPFRDRWLDVPSLQGEWRYRALACVADRSLARALRGAVQGILVASDAEELEHVWRELDIRRWSSPERSARRARLSSFPKS